MADEERVVPPLSPKAKAEQEAGRRALEPYAGMQAAHDRAEAEKKAAEQPPPPPPPPPKAKRG